jgi:hypothetical protein
VTGLPDWHNIQTKTGGNVPDDHKIHIPNVHRRYKAIVKYPKWPQKYNKFSILGKVLKIYPNMGFWFGNIPSGNSGVTV